MNNRKILVNNKIKERNIDSLKKKKRIKSKWTKEMIFRNTDGKKIVSSSINSVNSSKWINITKT